MGISAQQMLQNDPDYLARQAARQEIQQYQNFQNPQLGLAATSGALLGRGIANLFGGRGFFEVRDPALRRVTEIQSLYDEAMKSFDPDKPDTSYSTLAKTLAERGYGREAALAAAEANKYKLQAEELGIKREDIKLKRAKAGMDLAEFGRKKTKAEQEDIKFYTDNPDQATFELQRLAEQIAADPTNTDALKRYEMIAAAGSTGAQERFAKEEKETLGTAKDRALLAKYNKELEDAKKFGPAERWDAETDAARKLMQVYNIDITKPLEKQIKGSTRYGEMAGELSQAFERAVRRKTTEGGTPTPTPAAPKPTQTPAPTNSNIEAAVKAAGQNYEPDKYDYRVLANGAVQRRLK